MRLRLFGRARPATEMRDDLLCEQPHTGAHLLRIDSWQRHPERQMRVIGIALEQLDYVVGRADDERLTEEAWLVELAQLAYRRDLGELLVAGNVGRLGQPLPVLGHQVMDSVLGIVPRLVAPRGDIAEAELRDVEVSGIAAGRPQRFAVNVGLLRYGAREMVAIACGALGRRAGARADPNGHGLLDGLGVERHVAHREVLALVTDVVLTEYAPDYLDAFAQPRGAFGARDVEALELLRAVALSQTEVEPPVGQYVECRRLLRDVQRMMQRHEQDEGPDADLLRACCDRRPQRHHRR